MAKTKAKKKKICANCGVVAREYTAFCYNCGTPVGEPVAAPEPVLYAEPEAVSTEPEHDEETKSALDDLAARLKIDEANEDKLAKAAAERKKARVIQRKSKEFVWEPREDSSGVLLVLATLAIAVLASVVVFLTVFWR